MMEQPFQKYWVQVAVSDLDRKYLNFDPIPVTEERLMHEMFECRAPEKGGGHLWYLYRDRRHFEGFTYITLQNWPRPEENEELEP